ncbi:HD family phosphohydrolase [Urechidicola vernalis]|uniref:HDIG domain-containing protein n=1 Tax=Urechidicola vernalis TaxID=3075600 RepID=A0ABU2Y4W0_9FLAO|nr:HDIG domain-containing metalloprotein [Urechidicola sp. P050]MDT0552310.1 HDIG domain-containing protein [Urechidicola sp. P050]
MKNFLNKVLQQHSLIYKLILYVLTVVLIVFLFPKGGKFKYDYFKGKPWLYENYYAPFNFAIQKSQETIDAEILEIEKNSTLYFKFDEALVQDVRSNFDERIRQENYTSEIVEEILPIGQKIISSIYDFGFIDSQSESKLTSETLEITLRKGNLAFNIPPDKFITSTELLQFISSSLANSAPVELRSSMLNILSEVIRANIHFDEEFTEKAKEERIKNLSYTTGFVAESELVILKGDIVEGKKLEALNSIRRELESQVWSESNYNWVVFGYSVLVALALLMLLLFLRKYRNDIYENSTKTTLIFLNIALMVFLVTVVVKIDVKYVYAVPLCILPIILKAFFDARLGLFAHVLTVLLLGFIVPNSFEFIFLQIIAGIVTILTVSELYRRVNLFISIGQITMIYMIAYIAFTIIQEGNIEELNWFYFRLFAFNGVLAFLVPFLIFLYEKVFGLVSDVSLLELSNTNSTLLRMLAEKAPGTFQHSMQVANLAEAAANEIGANAMLVRTGALYHDIGKMNNPMYFTENQSTNVNPHSDLSNVDSAGIIINHVIEGIELAKKNRLPDRIIDFIRTHHGTSLVYYFYMQEKNENPEQVAIEKFRYPGPNPFSKETAILMMCDAAEAASKSLKEPTAQAIDNLIEKIISKQMEDGQFMNADITFKDIVVVKKVLKKKVKNIYHVRIDYPE